MVVATICVKALVMVFFDVCGGFVLSACVRACVRACVCVCVFVCV